MGRQQQRKRQQRRQGRQQPMQSSGIGTGWIAAAIAIGVVVVAALFYVVHNSSSAGATPTSPVPTVNASASLAPAIDGVKCNAMEALAYHIHQHIALYDNGKSVSLPSGIGMPGGEQAAQCFYWIHVHAAYPGIIHVESPIHKTFTVGNFFDIWAKTEPDTVNPSNHYPQLLRAAKSSQITAFVNGKPWTRGYRSIPLTEHAVITIEIGKPIVPPKPFTAWNGL